jgi:hypothetical protein
MKLYNQSIVDSAERVARAAQRDFFGIKRQGAVTLSAVAGAGKSYFVTDTVKECRLRQISVAVAAPTNEQVFSLVRSIADSDPSQSVAYIAATEVELPTWAMRRNVSRFKPAYLASGRPVVVGTIHKFASSLHPRNSAIPPLRCFDALIIDESFQANSGSYFALADIAPRHMCVGDGGQIQPFTTIEAGWQWRGLSEDPLQTAIAVIHANHPSTPRHRFPITRRLDGRGASLAKHFYPVDHAFGPAVADGVRSMKLGPTRSSSARDMALDKSLDLAAITGWAYLELPAMQTLIADPDTAQLIVDLVARLKARNCTLSCEREKKGAVIKDDRVAVAVSHNDQKAMIRVLLDRTGLNAVVVNTANKLQGLEFDLVVCWHPLAGLPEADEFHVEAGRLCVMCTRHRHACIVVGRQGDRELVEGLPPSTPAYPGAAEDTDDVLRGWAVHRDVFAALAPATVQLQ